MMESNENDSILLPAGMTPGLNTTVEGLGYTKLVSDNTAFYFELIVCVFASGLVSILGLIANVINIVVFIRQGIFSESGSPSLLCLAISDLTCVVSILWLCISKAIVLADPPKASLPFDAWDLYYITGFLPHYLCAQITRMVTAYVAFERCICVVFPFKVKSIFTPKRTLIILATFYFCSPFCYSPVFITRQLRFKFTPITNTTRLVLHSDPDWYTYVLPMYYVNQFAFNVGAVVIVLLCTMVTVSRVKLSKAWKKSLTEGTDKETDVQMSTSGKDGSSSSSRQTMSNSKMQKEKKLVRMITSISVVFLCCYIPDLILMVMTTVDPQIRIPGEHVNLAMTMYSFLFLAEAINSTINIVVYYKMSSRYNQEFKALFGLKSI